MRKPRITEGVMMTRFEDIYDRFREKRLTTQEAADILGVSVRTFLRKRERYESVDFDGFFDLRLGRASSRRAVDQEIKRITKLYEERYRGFSVRHFYEFAKREHELKYGYTWTKNQLTKAGLVRKGKRGGDHRLRRERKPMEGMMIHQDGSTHAWIPALGHNIDLIITMDDATSTITSGFFVLQEGTESTFRGLEETIEKHGLFCSLYTDRGSHYWYTPEAGGRVDKHQLTQVGRALKQLGIQHIAAYSPQARGRSERMFRTLQDRLPKELVLQGVKTIEEANRYLKDVYLPRHNAQFTVKPKEAESAFTPLIGGQLKEILCVHEERTVQPDNTVSFEGLKLQILADGLRHHYVRVKVEVRAYIDETYGIFYGPRCLGRYNSKGQPIDVLGKLAA